MSAREGMMRITKAYQSPLWSESRTAVFQSTQQLRYPKQSPEFAPQVSHEAVVAKGFLGHELAEFGRPVILSALVDVTLQPAQQARKLAAGELWGEAT